MRVRALDANGDWIWGTGRSNYLTNKAARAQNIKTRCLSWLGDCFFDLLAGIDWTNLLGTKNPYLIDLSLQTVIAATDGVISVHRDTFAVDSNRNLNAQYDVTLIDEGNPVTASSSTQVSSADLLTQLGNIITTQQGVPIGY